ncbi:putative ubiquitin conjugation factor E4 [Iris pallida]|uniref:Ubiquitin conjugation factor E4 n=1 Tax=Iris pallida TaxID=29817 RepID=A0AAX6E6Q4_IRIPA|nr:putative ubiquitin conjugation factor E4 [Iris pallida]KAJ6799797.1 putative ubiquitin conjugation factor E4 [Iris pallida]
MSGWGGKSDVVSLLKEIVRVGESCHDLQSDSRREDVEEFQSLETVALWIFRILQVIMEMRGRRLQYSWVVV